MKNLKYFAICLHLLLAGVGFAQDSGSVSPGGATIMSLSGNADNYLSIPYQNESVATLRIGAVSESFVVLNGDISAITSLPFDEDGLYYAEFTTGDLAGIRYDIIALSNRTLFLEALGDDLRNHPSGSIVLDDQIRIIKHWLLGDIFGNSDETIILEPTVSTLAIKDLVFVPNNLLVGINKTPESFYYKAGSGWRSLKNPVVDRGNTKIYPGQGIVVRRRIAESTDLVSFGNNRFFAFSVYVQGGDGSSGNDSLLSLQYPEPVMLKDSGLADQQPDGNYAVTPSPSPMSIVDELYLYTPGSSVPNVVFYWAGNGWYDLGGNPVGESLVIEPGSAFFIRKNSNSESTDWKFEAQ